MNLSTNLHNLIRQIGPGRMSPTVYDTAWIARLTEIGEPMSDLALEWLRKNQLPDGSWGASQLYYGHDRVISTLAAMNALARRSRSQDRSHLQRAEDALEPAIKTLKRDLAGDTVGFELLAPTLMQEVSALGAIHRNENHLLTELVPQRSAKLAILPQHMINRFVTVAFSAEMAGVDNRNLLDVDNLQELNGSVGTSPAATAYFALYVNRRDPAALEYLRKVTIQGKAPNVAPFDVFEPAWALWHLILTNLDSQSLNLCQPHLDHLERTWVPQKGVGFSSEYTPKDGDDTGLVYKVLTSFGRQVDLDAVLRYESAYYFRCYDLESNPSISANIHILDALRVAGLEVDHPAVQKIVRFLWESRVAQAFWVDKWHVSPYYATAHAAIACAGYQDMIIESAFEWILETQNTDGSWGYYLPTAEETAYSLQALAFCKRQGYKVPDQVFHHASNWLQDHMDPPYPPLWIGKCLYCPELVVRAAILSALILLEQD
ncbi:MAG: cyclase [Anaerolineae bacterium]|nr:cyclase [Anaerolineae bacterium]